MCTNDGGYSCSGGDVLAQRWPSANANRTLPLQDPAGNVSVPPLSCSIWCDSPLPSNMYLPACPRSKRRWIFCFGAQITLGAYFLPNGCAAGVRALYDRWRKKTLAIGIASFASCGSCAGAPNIETSCWAAVRHVRRREVIPRLIVRDMYTRARRRVLIRHQLVIRLADLAPLRQRGCPLQLREDFLRWRSCTATLLMAQDRTA